MQIAVCDDDLRFLGKVTRLLEEGGEKGDTVTAFSVGTDLLGHIKTGYPFDLTFLDIEMPGLNGLEVARSIRMLAPETILVLLTRYEQYALEAYQIHPFDYLVKPVTKRQLNELLSEVRGRLTARPGYTFLSGYQAITLPVSGIRYLESFDWALVLHYGEQVYRINGRLKHAREELAPLGFLQVHRSFLVNIAHARAVDRQNGILHLASGEQIPIAKQRMKQVLMAFLCKREGAL